MLNMILHMPEKYPLDMVVNFDLEIDWIWTKQVVDYMESRCKKAGIKFVRIKPRKSWNELYENTMFRQGVVDGAIQITNLIVKNN